jgi:hypothetical protein
MGTVSDGTHRYWDTYFKLHVVSCGGGEANCVTFQKPSVQNFLFASSSI